MELKKLDVPNLRLTCMHLVSWLVVDPVDCK